MKRMVLILIVVLISACSTAYQPYSYIGGGGYKDIQLSENSFKITVEANGYTSKAQASELALLRAADLTLERDFKYFIIANAADASYGMNITSPTTTVTNISAYGNSAVGTSHSYGGQTTHVTFPTPVITIVAFKEKPTTSELIYDAVITSRSLRTQLNIK